MATPKVLIKRSSVAGRAPSAGDLQYGELAINFADGKLYYKDNADNIKAFIDSARVQTIADNIEAVAEAQLDSGEVTALVDSAYVQARVPLSYLEGLIDSAYIQARQDFAYSSLTGAPNVLDSADVTNIVDSAYIQARQADIFRDSAFVTGIIDDAYIQARDRIRDSGFVEDIVDSAFVQSRVTLRDSGFVTNIVDSAYVQARQLDSAATATNALSLGTNPPSYYLDYNNLANKPSIIDGVDVSNIITTDVDKAFVDALNVDADTLDGYHAQFFIDKIDSNTARMLDSAEAIALVDSAYVQARQITYDFDSDFATKTTSDLTEGSNLYYTKARADSDIAASLNDSGNTVNVTINNTIEEKVDSAYVLARVNEAPFLDSVDAINLIDSAYVQQRQDYAYASLTGTPTNVSEFVNDANYLDSTTGRNILNGGANITYTSSTGDIALDSNITVNQLTVDSINNVELVNFNTTAYSDADVPDTLPTFAEGNLFYFQGPDALAYSNSDINVKIGQDEVVRVYNNTGSDIAKGKVVYITGASNDFPTIALAKSDAFATVYTTIGLTSHAISNGAFGFVTVRGLFGGLNTIGFTAGDVVHVSFDSAGELTATQPEYPNYPFEIGTVLVVDSASGGAVGGCIQVNPRSEVFEGVRVQGNGRVDGNLTIAGDLSILGSEFKTTVTNLNVGDNFIYIGAGDTLTANFSGTGLNDATFKDYYEGDSNLVYYVKVTNTDSLGDTIQWGFDSANFVPLGFDSANGATTWDLGTDNTLIPLRYNIKVTFEAATGHTVGDVWFDSAAPVNQDLGIVGNYNLPNAPYSHAGFFRDASDQKFKVFNKYDPEVTGDINTSDPSFELGTMVANTFEGDLTGDVTGTVSDISNHTTTELAEGNNLYYTTARHDSDTLAQVDAAYVQARQATYNTSNFTDSAFVTGLPVSTFTNDTNYLDSTTVQGVIDATYIQANQTTYNTSNFTDSAFVTGLPVSTFTNDTNYLDSTTVQGVIDATYIQANQTTYDFLDSAETIALIDSAYVNARVAAGTDSATVVTIVNATVDSAYVQARQSSVGSSVDSATVLQIVDSAYILSAIESDYSSPIEQEVYVYTADSGQTVFTGVDDNGATLTFNSHKITVFMNGMLLSGLSDITLSGGNTITLTEAADSGDVIQVVRLEGNTALTDSASMQTFVNNTPLKQKQYFYTADSGQTAFTGADDFGNTLAYTSDRVSVFLNGLLLVDSQDYTATDGSNISLITAADSGDVLGVLYLTGNNVGLDSIEVTNLVDSAYIQARQADIFRDSGFVTDIIDSAYVQARQADIYRDSAFVTNIIDSAYINAAVGVANDSASTTLIIQNVVDSAYVQLRQDYAYASLTGTPTIPTLYTDFVDSAEVIKIIASETLDSDLITQLVDSAYIQLRDRFKDSAGVIAIIDSDYIETRRPAETIFSVAGDGSNYTFTGDGFSSSANNPTLYLTRGKTYKFADIPGSHPFEIRLSSGGTAYSNGVTNNGGSGTVLFTPDMDAPNSLVYQCTVHGGMVGDIVIINNNSFLDSAETIALIDSAYIQARQEDLQRDSAFITNIIDSAYVNARTTAGTDSAATIALIEATVDSAYVALREANAGVTGGGLDSALITQLIDSAYVQAREAGGGGGGSVSEAFKTIAVSGQDNVVADAATDTLTFEAGTGITITTDGNTDTVTISSPGATMDSAGVEAIFTEQGGASEYNTLRINKYYYTATASQTVFTGADIFSNTLNVTPGNSEVYLNGLLLVDSDDYSLTATTLTLTSSADSGYSVSIIETVGKTQTLTLNETKYEFTATASQTVFTGADDNGVTLAYTEAGFVDVFVNGILLSLTNDYTTNNAGDTITLTTNADSGDLVTVLYRSGNIVSPQVDTFEFTADSGQTVLTGADDNSNTLAYAIGSLQVHLNGVLLRPSIDFTATNGSTITMTNPLDSADDVVVSSFSAPGTYLQTFKFNADSAQTLFSGQDISGNRLVYQTGNAQVFLNGILLPDSDYTAITGNKIVLASGTNLNDELVVHSFSRATTSAPIRINAAWTEVTSTVTLTNNSRNIIDCSGGAITATLPASPSFGDEIRVIDGTGNAATNNITIGRNGKNIQGSASDFTIDLNRAGVGFVFYNDSQGWVLIEN